MQKTTIIRSTDSTPNNFTSVSNQLIQDKNLSLEARMLIIRIISLPRDWVIYKEWLVKDSNIGQKKFDRIWKECKDAGYINQKKTKNEKGVFHYHYEVSDNLSTPPKGRSGLNEDLSTPPKGRSGSNQSSPTPPLSTPGLSTPGKGGSIQRKHEEKKEVKKKNSSSSNSSSSSGSVKGDELLYKPDDITTLVSNENLSAEQKNRKSMKMAGELFDEYWREI